MEARLAGQPGMLIPGPAIGGQDAGGAPPLRLKGEEAIPGPDVEDGLAGEIAREGHRVQSVGGSVPPRRDDAMSQVYRVVPPDLVNRRAYLVRCHGCRASHWSAAPPKWPGDGFRAANLASCIGEGIAVFAEKRCPSAAFPAFLVPR